MNFAHVEDSLIRSVLEGDVSEDALCYALHETLGHASADQNNEDVPHPVTERRLALALEAAEAWNEHGDAFESLERLREVWRT